MLRVCILRTILKNFQLLSGMYFGNIEYRENSVIWFIVTDSLGRRGSTDYLYLIKCRKDLQLS
jgi:hypothetical protein